VREAPGHSAQLVLREVKLFPSVVPHLSLDLGHVPSSASAAFMSRGSNCPGPAWVSVYRHSARDRAGMRTV
jgi:hypothetical protein